MFKSRRKRQQQKLAEAEAATAAAAVAAEADLINISKYTLLDDIHLTHDFRSSVILPQLNKDLDAKKLSTQQQHLEQLRELNESPLSPPLSPPPQDLDGTKQYQELAAWRHERSQNRYSNGLFGGKQRGRPKPKKFVSKDDINEEKEDTEEEEEELVEKIKEVTATCDLPTMIQEQEFDFSDDEEPMKEMYEPDSDTEENFFFQDFSADNKSTKKKNQTRQRANKALSRFDLSSFARDLHDHRLSVIQPRDSKIIMTEDDELELEKLLERQRQRMSMMTMVTDSNESLPPPPPMPALDIIKSHQKPTNQVPIKNDPVVEKTTIIKQEHTPIKKVDLVQQDDEVSHIITNTAPLRPSVSSSSSMLAPKIDQLKRSVSATSIKSNAPTLQLRPTGSSQLRPNAPSIRTPSKLSARKSCSMDNISLKIDENEPSVTSAALDWISEDSSQNPTSFLYKKAVPIKKQPSPPPPVQPIKSRGLFGSLRQVSRSKTHSGNGVNSIKGLVRNFSSSHKPVDRDPGMSRAAMAVLQHNASKQENNTAAPEPTIEPRKSRSRTKSDANIISNLISRASSNRKNNNATKIVNMEDAAKKRAQVVRRTIIYVQPDSLHDMLKNGGNVPPPPLPIPSAKSSTRNTVFSESSLSPDDETVRSKEYVTATKIVRQTSVRKRVVEDTVTTEPLAAAAAESNLGLLSRNGSRRRYQLKSVNENEFAKSDLKHTYDSSGGRSSENSDYLEGVELREMSDGSVVWGLVKKQGNRKSFFTPNKHNEYEQVEEEVEEGEVKRRPTISTSSSSLSAVTPPPIPKRSPRRQETTDVYYSNQMTLPSLLKMMQDQHPGDDDDESDDEENYEVKRRAMASVDDQLDEMMRILTTPQQQQQQH
ncbi:hypothetical protein HPULCUR_010643 [Helicostylum pulchrum]|uniref:Uncharacterized protein n=1 Tax=Helicostylum pulchrum TaxID=562976 RepID=A0ABP9YER0_9FUNG